MTLITTQCELPEANLGAILIHHNAHMETCRGCQSALSPDTRFCVNCGHPRLPVSSVEDPGPKGDPSRSREPLPLEPDPDPSLQPSRATDVGEAESSRSGDVNRKRLVVPGAPDAPEAPVTSGKRVGASDQFLVSGGDTPADWTGVNNSADVPSLAALPPTVRHGLRMGLQLLGATLAVGGVMAFVMISALSVTVMPDGVSGVTLIKLLITSAVQVSGVVLFGDVEGQIEMGGSTLLDGSVTGYTPLWGLAVILLLTARIAGSHARRVAVSGDSTSTGQIAVETGIASGVAVSLLAVLITLLPVQATTGVGADALTQEIFALELSVRVGRVLVLGGLTLFGVMAFARLRAEGHLSSLRVHPKAPLAGRVASVLRDHVVIAYFMLFPAALIASYLWLSGLSGTQAGDFGRMTLGLTIVWGPLMSVVSFLSAPITLFGVTPSFSAEGSADLTPFDTGAIGAETGSLEVFGLPGSAIAVLIAFGLLTTIIVGFRWGLQQAEGWHAQWGTAWLLPATYGIISLPLVWLAETTVTNSASIPFLGEGSATLSSQLPLSTVVLMGFIALGIEAVARLGTPWLQRAMPGLARYLSRPWLDPKSRVR